MIQRWSGAYWDFLISNKEHQDHIVKFHHLMKYWAMRPDIQLPDHYSNIIVDEAQDTNGAFYQVLQNHIDRNFVVIGDRHQQLYKWRGAINTMNMFELPSKSLTISRRFGDNIAQCANRVLESKRPL
jgi:superfamily I DNA/RNA helicase